MINSITAVSDSDIPGEVLPTIPYSSSEHLHTDSSTGAYLASIQASLCQWEASAGLGIDAFARGEFKASLVLHQRALSGINEIANSALTADSLLLPMMEYDRLFAAVTVSHLNIADCHAACGKSALSAELLRNAQLWLHKIIEQNSSRPLREVALHHLWRLLQAHYQSPDSDSQADWAIQAFAKPH